MIEKQDLCIEKIANIEQILRNLYNVDISPVARMSTLIDRIDFISEMMDDLYSKNENIIYKEFSTILPTNQEAITQIQPIISFLSKLLKPFMSNLISNIYNKILLVY